MKNFSKINQAKYLLVIMAVFAFVGCDDNANIVSPPPIAPKPYIPPVTTGPGTSTQIELTTFRGLATTRVSNLFASTDSYDGKIGNVFYYNYERFILDEVTNLNSSFQASNLNLTTFAHNIALSIVHQTYTESMVINITNYPGVSTYYNTTQISILNSYFNNMFLATSALKASIYYTTAKSTAEGSSLSNEQKIAVIAMIEVGNQYAQSFFANSWNTVYSDIQAEIASATNGRTQTGPCTISWKGVWLAGVVGGVYGGVKGAIVGAGGGTVALPGVGTVTGGVAGGVFGFAGGFVGGCGFAVVEQLMANCIFKEETTLPSAQCMDFRYSKAHPSACEAELNYLKKYYLLNYL